MIDPVASTTPIGTWAKHNTVEVVKHDRKHGEQHRLQTVFRTVYYEFADGKVRLQNYTFQNSSVDLKA